MDDSIAVILWVVIVAAAAMMPPTMLTIMTVGGGLWPTKLIASSYQTCSTFEARRPVLVHPQAPGVLRLRRQAYA